MAMLRGLSVARLPRPWAREVNTLGREKKSEYDYLEKEIGEVAKKVTKRYQIASLPESKKTKKFNRDSLYKVAKHLGTMDWLCSALAPVNTKLGLYQRWWKLDNALKNYYGLSAIKKKLVNVDPFWKESFPEKCLKTSRPELEEALTNKLRENGIKLSSIVIESGRVRHTRVFHYGHEKDVLAQVAVRYDVMVNSRYEESKMETLYVTHQRFLKSGKLWTIHEVEHMNNFNDTSLDNIDKEWTSVREKNYYLTDRV